MENELECIGCRSYYLYFSRKENKYLITHHLSETFDSGNCIDLKDKYISDLIKLLQKHELLLENNKSNLSEQKKFDYSHPDAEGLAKLAREINENAKFNKNS